MQDSELSRNRILRVMQYAVTGPQLQAAAISEWTEKRAALTEKAAGFLEPFLLSRGSIFGLWQTSPSYCNMSQYPLHLRGKALMSSFSHYCSLQCSRKAGFSSTTPSCLAGLIFSLAPLQHLLGWRKRQIFLA